MGTNLTNAIEFCLESSSHSCVQRRCETDSVANEAERANSLLGRSLSVGSAVDNEKFKTFSEAKNAFDDHCISIQINQDNMNDMLSIADKSGNDVKNDMNMWYGCNKVAESWNGFYLLWNNSLCYANPESLQDALVT